MAVQVLTYELSLALGETGLPPAADDPPPANADEMERFYLHLRDVLLANGFLDPDNPRHLMSRLRRLFNRAVPDQNEINILRGHPVGGTKADREKTPQVKEVKGLVNTPIYMDYAATTPVDPRVAAKMAECLTSDGVFANPASSSHVLGRIAKGVVEQARTDVAALIGADRREIVWTSGATESDNLALIGTARFCRDHGKTHCHLAHGAQSRSRFLQAAGKRGLRCYVS